MSSKKRANPPRKSFRPFSMSISFIFTFLIMFGIWIVLSGRFDTFHLLLGVLSSLIIAWASSDFLLPDLAARNAWNMPRLWLRFIGYIPWLLYQILIANLHIMYLALHPRMMSLIDPRIIEFKTQLTGNMAQTTLANSITLTPGTITVSVSVMGNVTVHAIDQKSAAGLPGEMETRVTEVFREQ